MLRLKKIDRRKKKEDVVKDAEPEFIARSNPIPNSGRSVMTAPAPPFMMATPAGMAPIPRQPHAMMYPPHQPPHPVETDYDVRATIKRMRDDLDDAHSRIDVLIHLLREKIANPLIRGLDRAGR